MTDKDIKTNDNKKIPDTLFVRFTIVLIIAFAVEVMLRSFPTFLKDLPDRRWIEWLLVSLIGVCAYLLWNVAIWYRRPEADFEKFRYWYRATAARGPVIALIVMLAITHINFQVQVPLPAEPVAEEVATEPTEQAESEEQGETTIPGTLDFGVNFSEANDTVLLVTAFILGFYSRLAREVMNSIAKFIFKDAYTRTYQKEEEEQ